MTVFVVVVRIHLKFGSLRAAFGTYGFCFRFLLRSHCRNTEFAKLQVSFYPEKSCASTDERTIELHAHITGLYVFDNIVFLAFVSQFHHLLVEFERRFGVVIHSEVHFVAHRAVYVHLNFHIELWYKVRSLTFGKCRVFHTVVLHAQNNFRRALRFNLHTTRAKNFIGRTDIEFHVGHRKLIFVIDRSRGVFFFPVILNFLFGRKFFVLFAGHHKRSGDFHASCVGFEYIISGGGIVFHYRFNIFGLTFFERIAGAQIGCSIVFETFLTKYGYRIGWGRHSRFLSNIRFVHVQY